MEEEVEEEEEEEEEEEDGIDVSVASNWSVGELGGGEEEEEEVAVVVGVEGKVGRGREWRDEVGEEVKGSV